MIIIKESGMLERPLQRYLHDNQMLFLGKQDADRIGQVERHIAGRYWDHMIRNL